MRDLKADLEICERATPGPWWNEGGVIHAKNPGIWTEQNCSCVHIARVYYGYWENARLCEQEVNGDFIDEAREGWPEAVRRAMAAEERVRELEVAIHAECERCSTQRFSLQLPEECSWDACPLWPHRPGAKREEAKR